uniref:PAP2_C domain-containing protein n=1 Tax=Syphacia muris TaxID=451379 RepID=A0A0N5ALY2_9BILA
MLAHWDETSKDVRLETGVIFQRNMVTSAPHELHKIIFVIIFFLFAAFTNWAALAYIHDFVGRKPLPDLVFHIIPQQVWALKVGDLIATFCSLSMLVLMALHKKRFIMFRRVFFIVVKLLLKEIKIFQNYEYFIGLFLQNIDQKMLCGDLLFSGHTLSMVISSLTIAYYLPKSLCYLRYIPTVLCWIGMMCMVISRTHYTVDVLFAYWLTTGFFCLYHAFCEIDTVRSRRMSVLRQLWIFRVVSWLEENVSAGR